MHMSKFQLGCCPSINLQTSVKPEVFINILKGTEARPEGRSLTTPTTASSCAEEPQSSVDWPPKVHWKPTINPTNTTQLPQGQNATTPSWPFHHTAHTRAHLISWEEQHHLLTTTPTSHLCCMPFLWPHNHTRSIT